MNTRNEATMQIKRFLSSDEKYCLVTGTHQYEKHRLVLRILAEYYKKGKFLFRSSTMLNASQFLGSKKKLETGMRYDLKDNNLYVDTVQKRTWMKTPNHIDIAVIYPLMPLVKKSLLDEITEDLGDRGAQKIFFVSSFDTIDTTSIEEYNPFKIIYDVLEEDPAYHQRVLDNLYKKGY